MNPLDQIKSMGGAISPAINEQYNPGVQSFGMSDTQVPSYGLFKWFKKKVMDDILGIDKNKFLGIKHSKPAPNILSNVGGWQQNTNYGGGILPPAKNDPELSSIPSSDPQISNINPASFADRDWETAFNS